MKKLVSLLLALCMCLSIGAVFTACDDDSDGSVNYTVTKEEWEINFNLTKGQTQEQTLSLSTKSLVQPQLFSNERLAAITSYTVYAEGENAGTNGTSLLKVSPDAMSIEFYLEGVLREDESGTYESSTDFYKNLIANVTSYFPFANYYDDFTFDQVKNAYICQNLTSAMVDEYDGSKKDDVYTKYAEVTFANSYLNTISVELCDKEFENTYASFVFTFSNINDTTVEI